MPDVEFKTILFKADAGIAHIVLNRFGMIAHGRIRCGAFKSAGELVTAIQECLHHHNADPKPFVWTAEAADILEKVARGRQALGPVL
jgi:hypothetical protein